MAFLLPRWRRAAVSSNVSSLLIKRWQGWSFPISFLSQVALWVWQWQLRVSLPSWAGLAGEDGGSGYPSQGQGSWGHQGSPSSGHRAPPWGRAEAGTGRQPVGGCQDQPWWGEKGSDTARDGWAQFWSHHPHDHGTGVCPQLCRRWAAPSLVFRAQSRGCAQGPGGQGS